MGLPLNKWCVTNGKHNSSHSSAIHDNTQSSSLYSGVAITYSTFQHQHSIQFNSIRVLSAKCANVKAYNTKKKSTKWFLAKAMVFPSVQAFGN